MFATKMFCCLQRSADLSGSRSLPNPLVTTRSSKSTAPVAAAGSEVGSRLAKLIGSCPSDRPLPTTRELGRRFGVANTTVYRLLQDHAAAGEVWQHPTSGRYYTAAARLIFERPKPVACLTRCLELASEQYREILEGINSQCGALHRAMLLWYDDLLVNHPVTQDSPVFASPREQRLILTAQHVALAAHLAHRLAQASARIFDVLEQGTTEPLLECVQPQGQIQLEHRSSRLGSMAPTSGH